jgi:hypothetical protein
MGLTCCSTTRSGNLAPGMPLSRSARGPLASPPAVFHRIHLFVADIYLDIRAEIAVIVKEVFLDPGVLSNQMLNRTGKCFFSGSHITFLVCKFSKRCWNMYGCHGLFLRFLLQGFVPGQHMHWFFFKSFFTV